MMILLYLFQLIGVADSFAEIHARTHRSSPARMMPSTENSPHVCKPPFSPPSLSCTTSLSLRGGMDSDLSQAIMPPSSSVMLCQEDSWRQYVPVVVIGLVLIDVLLGSPFAKSLLNKARPESVSDERSLNNRPSAPGSSQQSSQDPFESSTNLARGGRGIRKPRMDVDGYAKAALERAEGVAQLREYLEAQKTDWDRMEDMKRQMDQKMQELDRKNRNEAP
jgi:hypothetical protein